MKAGDACTHCGYSKFVEVAHIKAVCRFPDTATLAEINHPDNLLLLCRNDHWEFDHGELFYDSVEKILKEVV